MTVRLTPSAISLVNVILMPMLEQQAEVGLDEHYASCLRLEGDKRDDRTVLKETCSTISACLSQAASDAATLDALWREIAGADPYYPRQSHCTPDCHFCFFMEFDAHADSCLWLRACKAVEGAK